MEQAPGRTCGEWSPRWSRFAGSTCDPVGDPVCSWRTAPRGKDPRWSSSWRTAPSGKDSRWSSLSITVSCKRDPTLEQGKSVRSLPPEEAGAAETTFDELTVTPNPHPPVLLGGEEVEKQEWSWAREEGRGGRKVFKIWVYFSLSYSDLIGDKLNEFPQAESGFARDGNWWVSSPCPYLNPRAFHCIFSPLSSWGRER